MFAYVFTVAERESETPNGELKGIHRARKACSFCVGDSIKRASEHTHTQHPAALTLYG